MKPTTMDACELLLDGALALASMESNGIRVDTRRLRQVIADTEDEAARLTAELKRTDVWKEWRQAFGDKAKLGSDQQLVTVLFDRLGVPYPDKFGMTPTGRRRADKEVLRATRHPFVPKYHHRKELLKLRSTYLMGLLQEVCDGYLHPTFNLHTARTYRSSSGKNKDEGKVSRDFNIQNVPNRNPHMAQAIRSCFIPRRGRRLLEVDFGQIEVRIAACYTQDPNLIKYILDSSTDMHRDMAAQIFLLEPAFLKENASWAKKGVRDWAKNRFVFPAFYGSAFYQIADHLWDAVVETDLEYAYKHHMPDGTPIVDYLESKGISGLGDCGPEANPSPGTFAHHIRQILDHFWSNRFPVYARCKREWYDEYLRTGRIETLTGFHAEGLLKRNDTGNYGIQGSSFHSLLWSIIQVQRWLERNKMKSLLVSQIHDCMVLDVAEDELQDVISKCVEVMTVDCPRHWPWIIVPLAAEAEVTPIGGDWTQKKVWDLKDGLWTAK